jgi:hypothetical protein
MSLEYAGPVADACGRCGESIVGLDDQASCPNCGLIAGLSRLPEGELRNARPGWLGALTWGAAMAAAGVALVPIGLVVAAMLMALLEGVAGRRQGDALVRIGLALGGMPGLLLLVAGGWRLTAARRPGLPPEAAAWVLRSLLLLPVLAALAFALDAALLDTDEDIYLAMMLLGVVTFGAALAVLFWRLGSLAKQAPAPLLATDAPWLGGLLLLLSCAPPLLVGLVVAGVDIERTPYPTVSLVWFVLSATAVLWAIYLLVRAALAFNKSRRQAAALWSRPAARAEATPPAVVPTARRVEEPLPPLAPDDL